MQVRVFLDSAACIRLQQLLEPAARTPFVVQFACQADTQGLTGSCPNTAPCMPAQPVPPTNFRLPGLHLQPLKPTHLQSGEELIRVLVLPDVNGCAIVVLESRPEAVGCAKRGLAERQLSKQCLQLCKHAVLLLSLRHLQLGRDVRVTQQVTQGGNQGAVQQTRCLRCGGCAMPLPPALLFCPPLQSPGCAP